MIIISLVLFFLLLSTVRCLQNQQKTALSEITIKHPLIASLKMTEGKGRSSLEQPLINILRFFLKVTPLSALRSVMSQVRVLLKLSLSFENRLVITKFSSNIDEIKLSRPSGIVKISECLLHTSVF
jgi:hypothetical protein